MGHELYIASQILASVQRIDLLKIHVSVSSKKKNQKMKMITRSYLNLSIRLMDFYLLPAVSLLQILLYQETQQSCLKRER